MTIKASLFNIKKEIDKFEQKYHRQPGSVSLLAVSKKQSIEKIKAAVDAGQTAFGESYLQEALMKIAALASEPIEWHFIGPIQSNKTRKIAEHFAWVQSIADPIIAKRLNEQRPDSLPPLNICLQVNISQEMTKAGVTVDKLKELANFCTNLPRLKLRGLMAIPKPAETFTLQSEAFHELKVLFHDLKQSYPSLDTLSMGMSDDLEAAIAEGSTMVRVGTRIFGKRG